MNQISWPTRIAIALASLLGVGYLPKASGTAGTAATIPLFVFVVAPLPLLHRIVFTLAALGIGTWAAHLGGRHWNESDSPKIVIDELVGYLITMLPFAATPGTVLVGFGLFRLFDIAKPYPCSWIDKNLKGGWGAMLDDVAAGVYALTNMLAIEFALARAGVSIYGLGTLFGA